jgi:type IV pilus assembly protein PilY1
MGISAKFKVLVLVFWCSFAVTPLQAMADDIDIFLGTSGGDAAAPNVIFMLSNNANWSRNDRAWSAGSQGLAELSAISAVLDSLDSTTPMNVGLAMYTPNGGYIRFAPRNMAVAANKTALKAIVNGISPQGDKVNTSQKNDSTAFYELNLYFNGLAPYTGGTDGNRDYPGNSTTLTPAGQGLTSGFALPSAGTSGPYNNPSTSCNKNFVIFISNSDNNEGDAGLYTYQTTTAAAIAVNPSLSKIDAWASYLYTNSVASTFVLDVYGSSQNNAAYSTVLQSAAKKGGGDYTQIAGGNSGLLLSTLLRILANIQAVNTTFASTSLPVNTTNRSADKNQVFIPMFRPDPDAKPRWMGNLKQFQIVSSNGALELGDSAGIAAVNTLTGYPADCATSYWTTNSGTYWQNVIEKPSPAGKCPPTITSFDKFSDSPDGPIVEKGGVAEVIRKGNNPPSTNTTPTWAVNRTIYTQSGTALTAFDTTSSGLSASVVNFISGQDVNADYIGRTAPSTLTRPSLHGDSIHSRPLPVDYGGTTGVTVYYGSNDGTLRAVDATNGNERWAFIAPEFFPTLSRLMNNSPLVNYPGMPGVDKISPTPTAKDYYFDGSLGLYQNTNNSSVWIYPSMRRGGRMVYAFDVTTPASPSLKWKIGCPNLTNDTGCTTGTSGIGQTWSIPNVTASINGYTGPVVVVGGGYDGCEDANTTAPTCTSPKGAHVYVIDADTGAVIKTFDTTRSVAADVALLASTTVGLVDHAYVADTGGNIYRIDFGSSTSNWTINRVAYTNGSSRKFLFPPALALNQGKVYVAIGSGDREHPLVSQYPYTTPVTNRFYVYLDDLAATTATNLDSMQNFTSATTCSDAGILPASSYKGWYMDLTQNGRGEQTVTSALIAGGMATFSTNRPIPAVAGTCATTLGEARGYWVNLLNGSGAIGVTASCGGTRSSTFVGGGLPPSPVMFTVVVDGKKTTGVIGAPQRGGGANSPIAPQQVKPAISSKRTTIYWKSSGQN